MIDWTLLAPEALYLLLLLPAWLGLGWYQQSKEKQQLQAFYQRAIHSRRRGGSGPLALLSLLFLVLAFARPAWDPQPVDQNEQGRDIIFLLDVSRSMLAADAVPNRLEAARKAIKETVNASEMDRFGLVAFAGSTAIKSPLTHDKGFFLYLLEQLGPDSVAHGGTRIEDALFKVIDKMVPKESDSSAIDLVMLTDGEDLGSQPERAIAKLNELNIRLLIVGLGDPGMGARVPARNGKGWAQDNGREYWSKMQPKPLLQMAEQAHQGIFFPVATAKFDLAEYIEQLRQLWPATGRSQAERVEYTEGYPWLIFMSLLCQLLLLLNRKQKLVTASLVSLFFCGSALSAEPQPVTAPEELHNISLQQVERRAASFAQEFPGEAAKLYEHIAATTDELPVALAANYNQAIASIRFAEQMQNSQEHHAMLLYLDHERVLADPLTFYRKARDLLQQVLRQQPSHLAAAKALQYLMSVGHINDDLIEKMKQHNQEPGSPDNQEQEDSKEKSASKEESSSSQESQNQEDGEESEQDAEAMAEDIKELKIPPPIDSAEDVIAESKQVNSYQRSPAKSSTEPAEKDW